MIGQFLVQSLFFEIQETTRNLKIRTNSALDEYLHPYLKKLTDSAVKDSKFQNKERFVGPWIPETKLKNMDSFHRLLLNDFALIDKQFAVIIL